MNNQLMCEVFFCLYHKFNDFYKLLPAGLKPKNLTKEQASANSSNKNTQEFQCTHVSSAPLHPRKKFYHVNLCVANIKPIAPHTSLTTTQRSCTLHNIIYILINANMQYTLF